MAVHISRFVILIEKYQPIRATQASQLFETYLKFVQDDIDSDLITDIHLSKDGQNCENAAHLRTWAGTKPYEIKGSSTKTSDDDGKDQQDE